MSWRRGERPNRRLWRVARLKALDRDGWACVKCGHKGRLEVDHIVPLEDLEDRTGMYALSNLQTLCRTDHFSKSSEERLAKQTPPEVQEWRRYVESYRVRRYCLSLNGC